MIDLSQLTPESTVGNLPSHNFQVSLDTPGHVVAQKFALQPEIAGVIIMDGSRLAGMISRRKFNEWMSQPYSIELYMNRPIKLLLDFIKIPPLQLADTCQIDEAAKLALNRPDDLVYEPLVIVCQEKIFRLVDMQVLLLGQSHMLTLATEIIKLQKIEAQGYLAKLKKEQERSRSYSQLLEFNLIEIQKQNNLLEKQKHKLIRQAQEIIRLNRQLIEISKLISVEGRKAFQATFIGINAICRHTDQIVDIGKALAKELEMVNVASRLIARVSQQIRYLAVQAAVVANRSGGSFSEFSKVASEIGKLVSQTFEAGRRLDQLANRFKLRVQELTESAREGAESARSLVQKIERAQGAIAELEELVKRQNLKFTVYHPDSTENSNAIEARSLIQKIERVEGALAELEESVNHQDFRRLIQKMERVLSLGKQKIVN